MTIIFNKKEDASNIIIPKGIVSSRLMRHLVKAKDHKALFLSVRANLIKNKSKILHIFSGVVGEVYIELEDELLYDSNTIKFVIAYFLKKEAKAKINGVDFDKFIESVREDLVYRDNNDILEKNEVQAALEKASFSFAKTMPNNPHSYTLRKNWDRKELFLQVVSYLRNNCVFEYEFGTYWRVSYLGEYKYWTHPIDLLNTDVDLINRKKVK